MNRVINDVFPTVHIYHQSKLRIIRLRRETYRFAPQGTPVCAWPSAKRGTRRMEEARAHLNFLSGLLYVPAAAGEDMIGGWDEDD